ncbi:dynamin family protein, partial [Nostoc sp. NIES-2111]
MTTKLHIWRLDEKVRLVDSPGLDDVRAENSQVTREFLKRIDIGILVVTGASDASQKKFLVDLLSHCDSVFVVLNKIDEWDRLAPTALEKVITQWKQVLQIEKIYPVCAFGYDIDTPANTPLDIRGVDKLREDINSFLCTKGKDLLLARHMGEKKPYAIGIITSAVAAVAVESFIPGSAVYITATQYAAISSLYYLYKGEILPPNATSGLIVKFALISGKSTIFLWLGSILPPSGVLDLAEAVIAANITLAVLGTVNFILESGARFEEEELLNSKFKSYQKEGGLVLKSISLG